MSASLDRVLARLEGVRRSGSSWQALCPAHADKNPSLSIHVREDRILLHCHAGCTQEAVLAALRIEGRELFLDRGESKPQIVAEYPYTDETGGLLFQVVRLEPKGFRQRRPDGRGGWIWNLDGTRRMLYRLPEVLAENELVVICEGEKDVDTARKMEVVATCNPGGAGKWREEFSECLRGKKIAIIADADEPGRAHAQQVAASLHLRAESVKVLELPDSKDLAEWADRGGTREALLGLIRNAPVWESGTEAENTKGFVLTRLGDLLAKPDTPVDWVLQNTLLSGGVSGVFAKPKVGKSTFCRNLCLAISRGGDFLGFKTKQGECVYLALEEREDDVRNDFRSMGADGSEAIYVHAASAPADGINALCDLVRQRRPVFVVIDPLFRLARIRDEKAYAETYAALGPLIDVAREVGTHVLLSHHAGKGMKSDAVDSPLGSTAIGGAVSTLVVLKRNESMRTIQTIQRVGADLPETVLSFEPETHRLTLGGTRFEADRRECEVAILDFLGDIRQPQTQAQIRDGVQGKTAAIRGALTELVRSSRVTRDGDGTKGKPFLYAFENSGSQHITGTREPESQNRDETRINASDILVPQKSQESILVPDDGEQPSTDVLENIATAREQEFVEGKL
jgi:putative DNA primase/helicase